MKREAWTGLLALAFVVALFLMFRQGPEQDLLHVWEIPLDEIHQIDVTGKTPYRVFLKEGRWHVETEAAPWEADPVRVRAWLQPLVHPHAKSLLGDSKEGMAAPKPYGLDPEQSSITLKRANGDEHTLLVGYHTPLKDNYYVQIKGEPAVYLFSVYGLNLYLDATLDRLKPAPQEEAMAP